MTFQIRNPLSAVLQNAEVLERSLKILATAIEHVRTGGTLEQATLDNICSEMNENLESVEAILICAKHQQRIADGELSLHLRVQNTS